MENTIFVGNENIPLVNHYDEDCYDYYSIPNTSRVEETAFAIPESTNKRATSTLHPRQKVKQTRIAAMYRHLNVTSDLDLINLD